VLPEDVVHLLSLGEGVVENALILTFSAIAPAALPPTSMSESQREKRLLNKHGALIILSFPSVLLI